jgi:hypothetical protein
LKSIFPFHFVPVFLADVAWRQAYLAKAKRWWSVRNSPIPPLPGVCHPTILFAVVEGAPALLDRLVLRDKAEEALSRLSAQTLVQANSLEVALVRSLTPIRPPPPRPNHALTTQHTTHAPHREGGMQEKYGEKSATSKLGAPKFGTSIRRSMRPPAGATSDWSRWCWSSAKAKG